MAAEGRRGVTMTVIAAAVRTVLRRDPGHFRGVETHPATERALTRAHRELSELEGGQLRALAAQSPRAADVVRIHQQVAADLETRFSNEQQLSRAAAAAVRADPAAVARQLGPMIVFLPQRITDSQAGLLRAVGEATDTTIVAGATGAEDADAVVVASVRRLGAEFDTPARGGGQARAGATVEALSVSDADDEVRPRRAGRRRRRPGRYPPGAMRHRLRRREPIRAPDQRCARRGRHPTLRRHLPNGGDVAAGAVAARDAGPTRPRVLPARRDGLAGQRPGERQTARYGRWRTRR